MIIKHRRKFVQMYISLLLAVLTFARLNRRSPPVELASDMNQSDRMIENYRELFSPIQRQLGVLTGEDKTAANSHPIPFPIPESPSENGNPPTGTSPSTLTTQMDQDIEMTDIEMLEAEMFYSPVFRPQPLKQTNHQNVPLSTQPQSHSQNTHHLNLPTNFFLRPSRPIPNRPDIIPMTPLPTPPFLPELD